MSGSDKGLVDILDELDDIGGQDEATLGDLVESFGHRGHGPFLLVPGLLGASPLGAIPLVPTTLALVIFLFAGQMLIGKRHISLPSVLRKRGVDGEKLQQAVERARSLAKRIDRWFHGRLPVFTQTVSVRIAAAVTMILAATVPFLEVVPFAAMAPMAAIALFGLALTVGDGALMIVGFVLSAAALSLGMTLI